MFRFSINLPLPVWVRLVIPFTVLSSFALLSACDSDVSVVEPPASNNVSHLNYAAALPDNTEEKVLHTGVFIDSFVTNLQYVAGDIQGVTDELGKFNYRDGDTVVFSVGGTRFPEVAARRVISVLDLYNTDSVTHKGVANTSRLLQTLDIDGDADNGIQIRTEAHEILSSVKLELTDNQSFESELKKALAGNGLDMVEVTSTQVALTHLSNSLLENKLVELSSFGSDVELVIDPVTGNEVLLDTDNDAIADIFDQDDDNDGVFDSIDTYPLDPTETSDVDSDGLGDNSDPDSDNDGVENAKDLFPLDAAEWLDNDGDGIGDIGDHDDDNDGVQDIEDLFPKDAAEAFDHDLDGIGDNSDPDDDNDGVIDEDDAFQFDATEVSDIDGDGIGDNTDEDNDNDGVSDIDDLFPRDNSEYADSDLDGTGDNADLDDDNDGVVDEEDAFPFDATEVSDIDGDGIGDNIDEDNDNDGVSDIDDLFPRDNSEYADSDLDGTGDNADLDDDNDGVVDEEDAFPFDSTESSDVDADGIGDNVDLDNDNDGVMDTEDMFPFDAREDADFDGDGIGDRADTDDDGDGTSDWNDDLHLALTINTSTLVAPDSCSDFSTQYSYLSLYCTLHDEAALDGNPQQITFLTSDFSIHGNLVQRAIDLAITIKPHNWADKTGVSLLIEGAMLSMNKGDPTSVKIVLPKGTEIQAVVSDSTGLKTSMIVQTEQDLIASSNDGAFVLDIDRINANFAKIGRKNFLKWQPGWSINVVVNGFDFRTTYKGYKITNPRATSITVGDKTITGWLIRFSLRN